VGVDQDLFVFVFVLGFAKYSGGSKGGMFLLGKWDVNGWKILGREI